MSQPIQYYSPGDCIARIFFTTSNVSLWNCFCRLACDICQATNTIRRKFLLIPCQLFNWVWCCGGISDVFKQLTKHREINTVTNYKINMSPYFGALMLILAASKVAFCLRKSPVWLKFKSSGAQYKLSMSWLYWEFK